MEKKERRGGIIEDTINNLATAVSGRYVTSVHVTELARCERFQYFCILCSITGKRVRREC